MIITVSRKSWHYRVWKFMQDPDRLCDRWTNGPSLDQLKSREKEPTAICGYFWTIVSAPLVCFVAFVVVPLVIGALALGIAPFYGMYWIGKRLTNSSDGSSPSLIVATISATKTRVCPRIIPE